MAGRRGGQAGRQEGRLEGSNTGASIMMDPSRLDGGGWMVDVTSLHVVAHVYICETDTVLRQSGQG